MTEPNDQPGTEIRAGDRVTHRETGEEGRVDELLPWYGSFEAGPETVLLTVAVVRWTGTRQRSVVRVDDLDKLTEGNDQQ